MNYLIILPSICNVCFELRVYAYINYLIETKEIDTTERTILYNFNKNFPFHINANKLYRFHIITNYKNIIPGQNFTLIIKEVPDFDIEFKHIFYRKLSLKDNPLIEWKPDTVLVYTHIDTIENYIDKINKILNNITQDKYIYIWCKNISQREILFKEIKQEKNKYELHTLNELWGVAKNTKYFIYVNEINKFGDELCIMSKFPYTYNLN